MVTALGSTSRAKAMGVWSLANELGVLSQLKIEARSKKGLAIVGVQVLAVGSAKTTAKARSPMIHSMMMLCGTRIIFTRLEYAVGKK